MWFMKVGIIIMIGLSYVGVVKTRKQIRKGEVQWVAWKGKYDSLYLAKHKEK